VAHNRKWAPDARHAGAATALCHVTLFRAATCTGTRCFARKSTNGQEGRMPEVEQSHNVDTACFPGARPCEVGSVPEKGSPGPVAFQERGALSLKNISTLAKS